MKSNNETLIKTICNKGFSAKSSNLYRLNFSANGQESNSQTHTAYNLARYQ
jgi:hypothetical protein